MFPGRLIGFNNNKNNLMVCRKGGYGRLRQVAIYWRFTSQQINKRIYLPDITDRRKALLVSHLDLFYLF